MEGGDGGEVEGRQAPDRAEERFVEEVDEIIGAEVGQQHHRLKHGEALQQVHVPSVHGVLDIGNVAQLAYEQLKDVLPAGE